MKKASTPKNISLNKKLIFLKIIFDFSISFQSVKMEIIQHGKIKIINMNESINSIAVIHQLGDNNIFFLYEYPRSFDEQSSMLYICALKQLSTKNNRFIATTHIYTDAFANTLYNLISTERLNCADFISLMKLVVSGFYRLQDNDVMAVDKFIVRILTTNKVPDDEFCEFDDFENIYDYLQEDTEIDKSKYMETSLYSIYLQYCTLQSDENGSNVYDPEFINKFSEEMINYYIDLEKIKTAYFVAHVDKLYDAFIYHIKQTLSVIMDIGIIIKLDRILKTNAKFTNPVNIVLAHNQIHTKIISSYINLLSSKNL